MNYDVLLTGATGFLGSFILENLINQKKKVAILKRQTSNPWRILHLMDFVDTFDSNNIPKENFNYIINTATAYENDRTSISDLIETNVLFPTKLLTNCNYKYFFNIDTTLPKHLNYYSLSKSQFVEYGSRFAKPFVNIKVEHMYGPKDNKERLIPKLMKGMIDGIQNMPLTEGNQKRDFIFVTDVSDAISILINWAPKKTFFEIDLGTSDPLSIREVAEKIKQISKSKTKLGFGEIPYRKNEIMYSTSYSTFLRSLGWKPKISIAEGLMKTLTYYQSEHYE